MALLVLQHTAPAVPLLPTQPTPLHPTHPSRPSRRCLPLPETWDAAQPFRLTCPEGQYNDLATAYLSSDVWVVRSFFNLGSESQPIGEVRRAVAVLLPVVTMGKAQLAMSYHSNSRVRNPITQVLGFIP